MDDRYLRMNSGREEAANPADYLSNLDREQASLLLTNQNLFERTTARHRRNSEECGSNLATYKRP